MDPSRKNMFYLVSRKCNKNSLSKLESFKRPVLESGLLSKRQKDVESAAVA